MILWLNLNLIIKLQYHKPLNSGSRRKSHNLAGTLNEGGESYNFNFIGQRDIKTKCADSPVKPIKSFAELASQ